MTARRRVAAGAALPLLVAGVLGVEVLAARLGPRLAEPALRYADAGATVAVWLGDSTAVGLGVADGEESVASVVARARGERVVMLARSGATAADVLADQVGQPAVGEADVIYVSLGANDVTHLTGAGAFADRYARLLERLPPGVPVVVLGLPDMGSPPRLLQPLRALAGWRGRRLDRAVQRLAADRPGTVHVGIAAHTGPAFRHRPGRYFSADRYHPGPAGYALWADAVLEAVEAPGR
ncbi:MAG TPA: SGNH/GDSL hydrolase family protein [Acidimicrobiales bacterium]|nr:SGNH/GDSL hydrolase family protein [Acidimicrobiales bacterium]